MSDKLSILIVGAGIAGLSAAVSCALAGHSVTVLEGAKELADVGAGFQITPNATNILQKWGLGEEMRKTWSVPTSCTVHRYAGKALWHEANFAANIQRKYRAPFVDMHRVDMQKILYDRAVELGVSVRLNHRIKAVRVNGDGSVPELEQMDGAVLGGDLIVGADGLWSICREFMLGVQDQPLPTGDLAYRIVLTLDQIRDEDLRQFVSNPSLHFWIGPKAHAVGYSMKSGTMYNLVLLVPDDLPPEVSRRPGSVDEMKGLFRGWDPFLTLLLSCVTTVDKWKLMHRAELDSWTNKDKNFVLIGDSCHPVLPYLAQGANSSIEDGCVLGRVLTYLNKREQLPQAITLFEALRKSRGEKVARETFLQRRDFHLEDGPEQAKRDAVFASQAGKDEAEVKFPSRWNCPEVQPWLYGYDAYREVDEAIGKRPLSE